MLSVLRATDNFDQEDESSVETVLSQVAKEREAASAELHTRQSIYQESLVAVQTQLSERNRIMSGLNDTSEAFDLFPDLAKKFAERQAAMIKLVSDATARLEQD